MKLGKVIMGLALIVLGVLLISMFWQTVGAKTAKVIVEDYDDINKNFKSYNAGDTVLIKDEIKDMTYDNTTKFTNIWFEGENGNMTFIPFKGDLRGEYKKGDTVLIYFKVQEKEVWGNKVEVSEGNLTSDKIHKLYLGGNAVFCVIILIGVLVLIYGLLKKKQKPMYYYPTPEYPAQPMSPQYPPQPPPQYPAQYRQYPAQQSQQAQPMYPQPPPPYPPPPQYQQQPQQRYQSYQQQPIPQPAKKKGFFRRLKKS